jgi:HEAT repeat protein
VLSLAVETGGADAAEALATLALTKDPRGLDLLQKIMKGDNGLALSSVARELPPARCRLYFDDLKRAAQNPVIEPKATILEAVARAGTSDSAQTLAAIGDTAAQPTSGVAFGVLGQMGIGAERALQQELTSGTSALGRETSAYIIRNIQSSDAGPVFLRALRDPDQNVQFAAALALADIGNPAGLSVLERARADHDVEIRLDAIVALAALQDIQAAKDLQESLHADDASIRAKTVWAMARSRNSRIKALAYEWRLTEEPAYEAMLAEKLLDASDPRDRTALRGVLLSRDATSRLVAAEKLLNSQYASDAQTAIKQYLNSPVDQESALAIAIAEKHPELWPDLATHLNANSARLRVAALHAIAILPQTQLLEAVKENFEDSDANVSFAAAKALVALDAAAARSVFQKDLNATIPHVRIYSAGMLLAMGSERQ